MASLLSIQTNRSVNYLLINVLKKEYRTFSDFTVSIPYAEHICKSVLFINLNGDSFGMAPLICHSIRRINNGAEMLFPC